jgi:MarR family transcriptional regulator, transcriptional regulator for hemolysin
MKTRFESFAEILYLLTNAWKAALDRRLKPLGLSRSKWMLMVALYKDGEGISQRTLAQRLGIEGPSLVRLLDRMERDGLVERRAVDNDRRVKAIHLSRKGQSQLETIRTIAAQLRQELMAGLPSADVDTAMAVLAHIRSKAEALE